MGTIASTSRCPRRPETKLLFRADTSPEFMHTCTTMHRLSPRQARNRKGKIDQVLDPEFFKALSDPTRVALLACLAKCARACSVSEMVTCCSVDPSVVSRHLSHLARAGIVEQTKQGRSVLYRVRYADLAERFFEAAEAFRPGDGCGC